MQKRRAVVVAQLAEWSLSIPEVRGSNPVIGKFFLSIYLTFVYCQLCIGKTKIKKNEAGNGPLKNPLWLSIISWVSWITQNVWLRMWTVALTDWLHKYLFDCLTSDYKKTDSNWHSLHFVALNKIVYLKNSSLNNSKFIYFRLCLE